MRRDYIFFILAKVTVLRISLLFKSPCYKTFFHLKLPGFIKELLDAAITEMAILVPDEN